MNSCTSFALFRINRMIGLSFKLSYPAKSYAKKDTGSKNKLML